MKFKKTINKRQRNFSWGLWAETLALIYLRLKGYRIHERRYKTPVGEIDLIAERGSTLVAVEVKGRPTLEEALYSIKDPQKRRITRAFEWYLQNHSRYQKDPSPQDVRFDVILVTPWRLPHHILNAW